jgi:hypothetical protein
MANNLEDTGMWIDIYVLATVRSASEVWRFLDHFIPDRTRAADEYDVNLGGREQIFATPEEQVMFCEIHSMAEARAYWLKRTAEDPQSAHVFFLADGGLVLGLSVADSDELAWDRWLGELQLFAGATLGYWICESPPEDTMETFMAMCQKLSPDQ